MNLEKCRIDSTFVAEDDLVVQTVLFSIDVYYILAADGIYNEPRLSIVEKI